MTDEERLVRAKDLIEGIITGVDAEWGMQDDQIELVRWVIEQAERAQELEERNKFLRPFKEYYESNDCATSISNRLKAFEAENQRYKQALEFYAAMQNYEKEISKERPEWLDSEVQIDLGAKARQALEGESE